MTPAGQAAAGNERQWEGTTGSFVAASLLIPVILVVMAAIIWFYSPEHACKKLDAMCV